MLSVLRRQAQSPFIQATVVIIALVFIFWGVGSSRRGGANIVATVNDEAISLQEYQQAYDRSLSQFREQFGGTIPKGLLESLDIKSQVLKQLIQRRLLQQAGEEMGVRVSNAEVMQAIQEMEAFRTEGKFDLDQYNTLLSASRTTPEIFESSMRSDLLSKKVLERLNEFAKVPQAELEQRFGYENEKIRLEYVSFAADDFKEKVEVDDEGLSAYYDENKEKYKTDTQIKLDYLSFSVEDEAEQVETSPEEMRNYYEQNIKRFTTPEKRSARHILFQVDESAPEEVVSKKREQAQKVLEMARAGADFAELAKQYSEGPSAPQGGNLGSFGRGQMVKPFEDAVFSLTEGDISGIVRTRFGFHIIKLEKIIPQKVKTFEEARKQIAFNLKREKAASLAFDKANKAYEDIILAGSLDKFAEESEVKVHETDFFSRQSTPSADASEQSILSDPTFLNAAFALKKGELSSLVDLGRAYAIIYAKDIKEPEISPLEEVGEQVRNDYIAEEAEGLARKAAEDFLAAVADSKEEGTSWEKEVEKRGLIPEETDLLSRHDLEESGSMKLPAAVIEKGFGLSNEKPYPEQIEADGNTFYVFRFKEKQEPQPQLFAEEQEEFKARLLDEKRRNLLTAWFANLEAKAKITVNKELL